MSRSGPSPDAAVVAAERLGAELAVLGPAPVRDPLARSTAAPDWAASGGMLLTGRPDGPVRPAPGAPASWIRAAAALIGLGPALPDPAALIGERAAAADLRRNAPHSVGGAFRTVPTRDGWLGLSLVRDEDRALVAALIEGAVDDAWTAVTAWAAERNTDEAVDRALLLGLPASRVESAPPRPERPAVSVHQRELGRLRERPVVLNLGALWAGPLCAHLLGLAGARIVTVESVRRPDGARRGPAIFYDLLHAGHESVALDFADPSGRAQLRDLVAWADVVVEASRPQALERLGLIAADHAAAGRIWVSITAYGRAEPERVGFGDDVAAGAGLIADDGNGPYPVGDAIADPLAGFTAAAAAAVALRAGRGCLLDVSMHDVAVHAGNLPAPMVGVAGDDDGWWIDEGGDRIAVRAPRHRPVTGTAPALGAHTEAVLAGVGRWRQS